MTLAQNNLGFGHNWQHHYIYFRFFVTGLKMNFCKSEKNRFYRCWCEWLWAHSGVPPVMRYTNTPGDIDLIWFSRLSQVELSLEASNSLTVDNCAWRWCAQQLDLTSCHSDAVLSNQRVFAEVIRHHVTQVKLSLEHTVAAHLRTAQSSFCELFLDDDGTSAWQWQKRRQKRTLYRMRSRTRALFTDRWKTKTGELTASFWIIYT